MKGNLDPGKRNRLVSNFKNNVLVQSDRTVKLQCGHVASGHAVVTYADRRELWQCPQGCGLVRATKRIRGT